MSVEDIKGRVFNYNKTMYNIYIMPAEKFLNFMRSKFGPSKSNIRRGDVHREKKPCHLESKEDFK